jgi:hypothetical protein
VNDEEIVVSHSDLFDCPRQKSTQHSVRVNTFLNRSKKAIYRLGLVHEFHNSLSDEV